MSLYQAWLISVPLAFDCVCPKCQGKERQPYRTSASLIFSFSSFLYRFLFLPLYIYIFLSHQVHVHVHSPAGFFPLQIDRLSACFLQFPVVFTAFNLLILCLPRAKATIPLFFSCFLCMCVSSALFGMLFTALVALCLTPVNLAEHFEDEHSVLINQTGGGQRLVRSDSHQSS